LRPYFAPAGTAPRLREYQMKTNITIGEGELLVLSSNGKVKKVAATTTGNITHVIGVAAYTYTSPKTGTPVIAVYDDPSQLFIVDGGSNSPNIAQIGELWGLTNNSSVNATIGACKGALQASDNAKGCVKVVDLSYETGNVGGTTNADVVVMVNNRKHQLGSMATGV
jgi:hypothetical protein